MGEGGEGEGERGRGGEGEWLLCGADGPGRTGSSIGELSKWG